MIPPRKKTAQCVFPEFPRIGFSSLRHNPRPIHLRIVKTCKNYGYKTHFQNFLWIFLAFSTEKTLKTESSCRSPAVRQLLQDRTELTVHLWHHQGHIIFQDETPLGWWMLGHLRGKPRFRGLNYVAWKIWKTQILKESLQEKTQTRVSIYLLLNRLISYMWVW